MTSQNKAFSNKSTVNWWEYCRLLLETVERQGLCASKQSKIPIHIRVRTFCQKLLDCCMLLSTFWH